MTMSSYLRDKIVDHWLKGTAFSQPANIYISLHTGDPGLTGANEVTGGSYARQLCNGWSAVSGGQKSNSADILFSGMPACTVTYVGCWDTLSAGNFLDGAVAGSSRTLQAGDAYRIVAGAAVQGQT
jgi:hypothetical protein